MLAPGRPTHPDDTTVRAGRRHPIVEATLLVAVWIGIGLLLPGNDPNLYLLAGVPLTVAFQLLVRRRPLRALWVREAPPFRLDRLGVALAGLLMAAPVVLAVQAAAAGEWIAVAWALAAAAGAVAAAYALRTARRDRARTTLHWLATSTLTGGIVIAAALVPAVLAGGQLRPGPMLLAGVQAVLTYFPVCFVLEEVAFRGALDDHVHRADGARGLGSALLVSALWGLWHLPVAPAGVPLVLVAAQLLLVHVVVGVPLSLARRRTGSLVAPAGAHALVDGIRNGLAAGL